MELKLKPSKKIVDIIKKNNPNIFLVTFKTTAGSTKEILIDKALFNLKRSASSLVFANDIHEKINLIITDKDEVLSFNNRDAALKKFSLAFFERIEE